MAGPSGDVPLRPRAMRDRNRALVLDAVARHEPVTRAQLAARTGLTKSSVSSIVTELLAAHLVVEQGAQRGSELGRPGTALTLARDGLAGLGLEVNVDYLAACVVDLARRTRVQYVEVGDNRARDPAAVAELLARLAAAAVAAARTQGLTISATCVAVPGLVDQETGAVARAPNLDWSGVPLRRLLAGRVPAALTPVLVENEANLAALGELFRGAHGHAGELGHTTLEPDGAACACGGRGCLELFCGQEAILRRAGLDPAVSTSTGRADGPVSTLVGQLAAGDGKALAALEVAGRSLGVAAASLVKLLDPDTVVLGGIYAVLAPWLREPFQRALLAGIPMTRAAPPRVAVSALGPDAAVRGAAGLVTASMLARPGALLSVSARA